MPEGLLPKMMISPSIAPIFRFSSPRGDRLTSMPSRVFIFNGVAGIGLLTAAGVIGELFFLGVEKLLLGLGRGGETGKTVFFFLEKVLRSELKRNILFALFLFL